MERYAKRDEISQELDRLITQGHQDTVCLPFAKEVSRHAAQAEVEAGLRKGQSLIAA